MFDFFKSTSRTFVTSAVYNLAGDVKQRPDFMKTTVVSHILSGERTTATRNTLNKYISGPGINLRRFGYWAKESGYNSAIGASSSSVTLPADVDSTALTSILTGIYGKPVVVNESQIGYADYYRWAMQYMLANRPDQFGSDWTADYDELFNQVILRIPGEAAIAFTPVGFENLKQYLYVRLNQEKQAQSSSSFGSWILGYGPSRSGYSQLSSGSSSEVVNTSTSTVVTKTKAGNAPRVHTVTTPASVTVQLKTTLHSKYSQLPDPDTSLMVGIVTDSIATRQRYELVPTVSESTQTVGDETTHIVRTDQVVRVVTEYQVGKVTVRQAAWTNEEIFIYKQGSGNAALDNLFSTSVTAGTFFPVIPVRIDNQFVSSEYYGHIHPWVKKAVRRATNYTYETLVEQVSSNPSLGDIDFAYMVFGTSLNTPENTAKRYIYEFFRRVGLSNGDAALNSFWTNYSAAVQSWSDWVRWYTQLRNVSPRDRDSSISYDMPERLSIPELPVTNIVVSAAANYSVMIGFSGVSETTHAGKYTAGAKVNDLRIYNGPPHIFYGYPERSEGSNSTWGGFVMEEVGRVEVVYIDWQVAENTYRRLKVTNPTHTNNVYEGRSIKISSSEALGSGSESGFIIPMQDEVLRALPIPIATQMVTACNYLVFNCYKTVKQEWYETAFFKFILIIVIVVVAVYTGTDGGLLSGGLLGSNAAVGATLGFVGTTAIVVGAIANAIVGMIVSQIITRVSVKVFGEKFGSIIGAIASIVVLHVGAGMASGQPMGAAFSNMMNAENLMKLTVATVDGLSQYVQSTAQDYANQTADLVDDYTRQMKEITEKYLNDFGPGNGADIQTVQQAVVDRLEKPETFLARTLLTGTDIADMSHSMLDNFTEFSVTPNLE